MNVKALVIVAALLAAGVTWWIEGMRWDKDVSSLKESHALALKNNSDKAFADLAAANRRTAEAQAAAAELDNKFTERLTNAQAENEALRSDIAVGTRSVRIAAANLATCQLTRGKNTGAGGVGDAVQVDLTPAGGSVVLNLRESTNRDAEVIKYLQGYIERVLIEK